MITRQQALTAPAFHEDHEPAGKIITWRRNGATKTWVTRPAEFRVPVKYGLRGYGYITELTASGYHTEDECPTRHVRVDGPDGEWHGIVTEDFGNGITRVQVTVRGSSRNRVGRQYDV